MTVAALLPHLEQATGGHQRRATPRPRSGLGRCGAVEWNAYSRRIAAGHFERCRTLGLRTVVGGPIASSVPATELKADHVVIGEAESLIGPLAMDLEQGTAKPIYEAAERPEMQTSPLPDLSLIKMRRYSTMAVQYSRGCPFNCEFCDIIEIYGRRPRTKAIAQVLAELDQLRAAGWRRPYSSSMTILLATSRAQRIVCRAGRMA